MIVSAVDTSVVSLARVENIRKGGGRGRSIPAKLHVAMTELREAAHKSPILRGVPRLKVRSASTGSPCVFADLCSSVTHSRVFPNRALVQLLSHVSLMTSYNAIVHPLLRLLSVQHTSKAPSLLNRTLGERVGAFRHLMFTELKQFLWHNALHDTATGSRYDSSYVSCSFSVFLCLFCASHSLTRHHPACDLPYVATT